MSNGVYCGCLIFMADGQAYPDADRNESKWCVGITWQIVDRDSRTELKRGAWCHLGYCRDTSWLFPSTEEEKDQGIAESIAQYYALKYLKQFPATLDVLFVTDRIAHFETIEREKRHRDDELRDKPFARLLRLVRFELGQCMAKHGVIMVKHKNYVSYPWTPDWYARTPANADSLAFALLPDNRDTFMPGLPIDCILPNKTMVASGGNATACVFFLNKVWFRTAAGKPGCLATVTLIMNGAPTSATRKLELMQKTVEQHAAKFGGPLAQID